MTAASLIAQKGPYPGMRPFEKHEASLFFGQESQIGALLQRLGKSRLIVVVGESGCGKSSLIKAGLIPKLFGSRVDPRHALWRIAVTRPGRAPIASLARQLVEGQIVATPVEDVETMLRSGSHGLLQAIQIEKRPAGGRVLIVVDQFE